MTHSAPTDHRPWLGMTQLIKLNRESVCDSKNFQKPNSSGHMSRVLHVLSGKLRKFCISNSEHRSLNGRSIHTESQQLQIVTNNQNLFHSNLINLRFTSSQRI